MPYSTKNSVLSLIPLCKVLEEAGHPPEPILKRHGIRLDMLSGASMIERAREFEIIQDAVEMTKDPLLGLKVGRQSTFALFGTFSLMVMTAANFREATQTSVQFQELSLLLTNLNAIYGPEQFELRYTLPDAPREIMSYIADRDFAGSFVFMAEMLNENEFPTIRGGLARPEPESALRRYYRLATQLHLEFDQPYNWFAFPNLLLRMPLKQANALAHRLYRVQAQELLLSTTSGQRNIVPQIRQLLQGYEGRYPSSELLARMFDMSERNLRRKLSEANTSYRELLEERRIQQAKNLLLTEKLSVNQIAERLGYTEAASFLRAFKRWTGRTPKEFRVGRGG